MADYSALKATIDASINTNGQQAITGAILNDVLNEMVDVQEEFNGEIDNLVENYPNITINGDVTNAPDEEDITSDANNRLKFANRPATNGMGYVILRKNKTFATQVTQANTIYEIRYSFDLGGASVTIPAGCVLKFEGGKLSNGTLVGQNTELKGNVSCDGIVLNGTITNYDIYLSWFGLSINAIKDADLSNHRIVIDSGITLDGTLVLQEMHDVVVDGRLNTIQGNGNSFVKYTGNSYNIEVKNCIFRGTGVESFVQRDFSVGGNFAIDNICVHDNDIYHCPLSISFDADLGSTSYTRSITNCKAYNNNIDCNDTSEAVGHYGIHLSNASNCEIYNNKITRCQRHAIYHAYGEQNKIFGNYIYNCRNLYDDDLGNIVIVRESHNVEVFDNTLMDNGGFYIQIAWNTHDTTFANPSNLYNVRVYNNKFLVSAADKCRARVFINIGNNATSAYGTKNVQVFGNTFASFGHRLTAIANLLRISNLEFFSNVVDYDLTNLNTGYTAVIAFAGAGGSTDYSQMSFCNNTFNIKKGISALVLFSLGTAVYPENYQSGGVNTTIEIRNNNYVNARTSTGLNYSFGADIKYFRNIDGFNKIRYNYQLDKTGNINTGEWNIEGDIIYTHTIPAVSDGSLSPSIGYVCVDKGNPGVWRQFGINACSNPISANYMPNVSPFAGRVFVNKNEPCFGSYSNEWISADGAKAGVKRSGTFADKPSSADIYIGFKYFCTDKQTTEGATNGIEIIHKGGDVWVDALGRVVN